MLSALALASFAALAPGVGPGQAERILLVDIDDVGYDLLRDTPTPTLDWIEANGRFFTAFTTSPICSPTRAMVQSGALPSHPRVLLGKNVRGAETYELPVGSMVYLPELLTGAGRTTAKVGKWHLCPRTVWDHPNRVGWTNYIGVLSNLVMDTYTDFAQVEDGIESRVVGRYLTTEETDQGIGFVRDGIDFVSVSYHAPHKPFHVPPAHLHSISPVDTDRDKARAMLQAVDRELARLVRAAIEVNYTILVFSDNGTTQDIGGGKGTFFDTGTRTPFWAIGPGVLPGLDDSPVHVVDLYDTIAELFGLNADGADRGPHSDSFAAQLCGVPRHKRWTYTERFEFNGINPRDGVGYWRRSVRGERYKLIREPSNGLREQFYDLVVNPSESFNWLEVPDLMTPEAESALEYFREVLDRV